MSSFFSQIHLNTMCAKTHHRWNLKNCKNESNRIETGSIFFSIHRKSHKMKTTLFLFVVPGSYTNMNITTIKIHTRWCVCVWEGNRNRLQDRNKYVSRVWDQWTDADISTVQNVMAQTKQVQQILFWEMFVPQHRMEFRLCACVRAGVRANQIE